jgi:DNA ligase (NAD+)
MDDAATVAGLSTQALTERMQSLEQSYREGHPLVSDEVFDHVYCAELKRRQPNHPLLQHIGVEPDFGDGKVKHTSPMLSTEKAYTVDEIASFVAKVRDAAIYVGVDAATVEYRMTAKLDGMAARFDGDVLVTRGNGLTGNDITSAITKGVVMDDPGVGEIVMEKAYFDDNLADDFEHPRNVVVGAVSAKEPNADAQAALNDGAIRFVNYENLPNIVCVGGMLVDMLDEFEEQILGSVEYPTDGVIIEVTHLDIKAHMGATSHHHRWQIAKKTKGESAITTVEDIEWTTGRTGRVTPTILIKPVRLSGATLSRVTAHHAGNVKRLGIGVGASLKVIRSGEVIPFAEEIITPAEAVTIPEKCPACDADVEWEGDFIVCSGVSCEAQLVRRLHHFFDILGNLDLFGRKSVQKLVDAGHTDLVSIYNLAAGDFEDCGFGPKQAENLVSELVRSRKDAVEDFRFLGAMGIHHLGRGSSRRLLKAHPIETLTNVSAAQIERVESFGPVVAPSVKKDIDALWPTIRGLLDLGFNLVSSATPSTGVLSGKRIVFTGAMTKPRKEMEAGAARLGAEVQKAVSGKTDWLVTGERVGETKINKAEKLGVTIVPMAEYEGIIRDLS